MRDGRREGRHDGERAKRVPHCHQLSSALSPSLSSLSSKLKHHAGVAAIIAFRRDKEEQRWALLIVDIPHGCTCNARLSVFRYSLQVQ